MDEVDVLVVGAGPTALAAACVLRAHGVTIRVVDRAAGPAVTSRANLLHARGVEVLDRIGALGDLPEHARTAMFVTWYVDGRPISRLRFGDVGIGTARPALLISQVMVENRLRDRLAELDGKIEWSTPVTALRQDPDAVTVTLGDDTSVRARWVVGADGAHSSVRTLAGIGFPGAPVADRFLLGDVYVSWTPDRSGTHGWQHPEGFLAAMPMPAPEPDRRDDLWRLLVYLPGETEGELPGDEVLERMREIVPHRTGHSEAVRHDATWLSHFRIHRRLADTYRSRRILLAGDAAHVHSPFGGQGMLTGIGDAENLAWKLAHVVRGAAEEPLLDTYQAERRPLAAGVGRGSSATTRFQTQTGPVVRLLRGQLLARVLGIPSVQRRATAVASQLWVSYRRGPLAPASAWWFGRRPRPGDRVPDLPVRHRDGSATRLHAELGHRWAYIARTVPANGMDSTRLGNITALTSPQPRDGEVWLIRPDAHLAWRGSAKSPLLQRWLADALDHGTVR